MFSTERSDFAVPITGYLLMAVVLGITALGFLNAGNWLDNYYGFDVVKILSVILVIVGLVSLWKAYIVDGISFVLFGVMSYVIALHNDPSSIPLIIGVVMILVAAMAYRAGDILVLTNDVLIGIGLILIAFYGYNFDAKALALVSAIFLILAVAVSLFICYNDWSLVQDIASDYQESMFEGDDCCCCGDDCECGCHDDDCQCGCHDEKKE